MANRDVEPYAIKRENVPREENLGGIKAGRLAANAGHAPARGRRRCRHVKRGNSGYKRVKRLALLEKVLTVRPPQNSDVRHGLSELAFRRDPELPPNLAPRDRGRFPLEGLAGPADSARP